MLYTLIGNGDVNTKEVLASLESLRAAVPETEEFWMTILDPSASKQEPSSTLEGVVAWVKGLGIYHETVIQAEIAPSPSLKDADFIHTARRPLDFIVKLTKSRVQPGERSAILVLSDNLDDDEDALYTIERAISENIPVYELAGQMVQVLLEEPETDSFHKPVSFSIEEDPVSTVSTNGHAADEAVSTFNTEAADDAGAEDVIEKSALIYRTKTGRVLTDADIQELADEAEGGYDVQHLVARAEEATGPPETLENPKDFTLPESGAAVVEVSPLVLTRPLLSDLTRDELKHLVRTRGVTPKDMRSKDSMIEALLENQKFRPTTEEESMPEPLNEFPGKQLPVGDGFTITMSREPGPDGLYLHADESFPPAAESTDGAAIEDRHYYVRISVDGTPMITPLTQDMVELLPIMMPWSTRSDA